VKNPFRKKANTRGPGRSIQDKLKEERTRADLVLAKHWARFLEQHPSYAIEIAQRKFAVPEPPEEKNIEPPSLLEQLREIREINEELGIGSGGGGNSLLRDLLEGLPQALPTLQAIVNAQTAQTGNPQHRPQVQAHPQQAQISQCSEAEREMLDRIDELMGMTAEQVAQQIWVGSTKAQSLEAMLFNLVSGYEFDDLMNVLPQLPSVPGYGFLSSVVKRLQKPAERARLAAIFDELRRLEREGDQGENQANEGKSDEMASGFTLNAGDA